MSQRVGVVRFPGTNCEFDTIDAIRALDGEAEFFGMVNPTCKMSMRSSYPEASPTVTICGVEQ